MTESDAQALAAQARALDAAYRALGFAASAIVEARLFGADTSSIGYAMDDAFMALGRETKSISRRLLAYDFGRNIEEDAA